MYVLHMRAPSPAYHIVYKQRAVSSTERTAPHPQWSVGPCSRAGSVPTAVQGTVAYRAACSPVLCIMQPLPSPPAPAATSCARLGAAALDPSASPLRAATRAAPVRTNW